MLGACLALWHLWCSRLGQNGIVRAASWDSAQTRSQGLRGLKKTVTVVQPFDCYVHYFLQKCKTLEQFCHPLYGCLLNMTPSSAIPPDTTLYKMVHKHKPNYSTLCVFGCCTWAHVCHKKQKSLEPHTKPCVFLGILDDFKGWKLWDLSAQGGCGGMIILHNMIWNKEEFPGLSKDAHNPIPTHFGCIDIQMPAAA
jgi:hypothetical protein